MINFNEFNTDEYVKQVNEKGHYDWSTVNKSTPFSIMTDKATTDVIIQRAVDKLVNHVKVTLGAKGKTVLFNNNQNKPQVTKDGVTVARNVKSNDPIEQMIIDIVREASEKTLKSSGDGTTTTAILAQAIIHLGFKLKYEQNMTYYEIANLLNDFQVKAVAAINQYSIPVLSSGDEEITKIKNVATVSSNNVEIGKLIEDIYRKISIYGTIEIKETTSSVTRIDTVNGIKINKGYYNAHFLTDTTRGLFKVTEGAFIAIVDDRIHSFKQITDLISESVVEYEDGTYEEKPLLILLNDIDHSVMEMMIRTKITNPNMRFMVVENDGFGDRRSEIMNDIAALTGAVIYRKNETGQLGYCEEILVDYETTSITVSRDSEQTNMELIDELIVDTEYKLNHPDELYLNDNDLLYYKKRLANLKGGIAVINVGGQTEVEMREKKDRIDDAVQAVSAAIKKGVCIGGGYVFIKAYLSLGTENPFVEALTEPIKILLHNSDSKHSLGTFIDMVDTDNAYNAITDSFTKSNDETYTIYDPSLVLIDSIENAIAVSKSILSIDCAVYNKQ